MKWLIFCGLLIIGAGRCEDNLLKDLDIKNIPFSVPDIDTSQLETEVVEKYSQDALNMLKQKCANTTGGDQVFASLETQAKDLQTYITDNINFTVVMSELEEAKKTGSMDEVFAKYCVKKSIARDHLKNITETFKQCLPVEDRRSVDLKFNLTEKMVNFLCEKDGDKIAMFIASGGEECLTAQMEGIQECFNKSSTMFPSTNWQSVSLVEIDENVCEQYPVLEECVVTVLEECKGKTPANIVGAMFKYLRKNMECEPQKESVNAPDQRKLDALVENNRLKRNAGEFMQNRFQNKCMKNSPNNPNAFNNLNASYRAFASSFFTNLFSRTDDCLQLKRDTELPMEAFLLYLKECLDTKEDFIPNFIRDSVAGIFGYLCDNRGQKLREYKNSKGLQCLMNSDPRKFEDCAKPTKTHAKDAGQVLLKEEDFCEDITTMRKCAKNVWLPPCSYDPRFKEISKDLLKIIDSKCSGCSIYINSLLLFVLALYHVYKNLL